MAMGDVVTMAMADTHLITMGMDVAMTVVDAAVDWVFLISSSIGATTVVVAATVVAADADTNTVKGAVPKWPLLVT